MNHQTVLLAFEQLSGDEKRLALSAIESSWESRSGLMAELNKGLSENRVGNMHCPYCESDKTIRRGVVKGIEKFSCNKCNKYFSSNHGTALYRIRLTDKWQSYLKLMEQGYSIKRSAKSLGISIQTSFDWRHKILASLESALPKTIGGTVECDDFQLRESFKGQRKLDRKPRKRGTDGRKHTVEKVSVVTAVSRDSGVIHAVVAAKKISGEEAQKSLEGRLEAGTILITDEASSFNAVAKATPTLVHKKVNSKRNRTERPVGKIHLQTVNNQHKQTRDFLDRFNGVATKYLPNYLNWFAYLQLQKDNREKIQTMLKTCLSAATALIFLTKLLAGDVLIRT